MERKTQGPAQWMEIQPNQSTTWEVSEQAAAEDPKTHTKDHKVA